MIKDFFINVFRVLWCRVSSKDGAQKDAGAAVLPKNYRSIVIYAISTLKDPVVLMDGQHVVDFSDRGPLTQRGIGSCIDFEIRDGKERILGFHDHPREMWASRAIAEYCAEQGWLKIQW